MGDTTASREKEIIALFLLFLEAEKDVFLCRASDWGMSQRISKAETESLIDEFGKQLEECWEGKVNEGE